MSLSLLGYGTIRATEDNRFSVFDTIEVVGGKKNPHQTWNDLQERYSEVLGRVENFQVPGKGQRLTPVATESHLTLIISLIKQMKVIDEKEVPARTEAYYRDRLHKKLGGKTEVSTPAGKIDLLTTKEVIEVKAFYGWKCAIGQIEVYSEYYPSHGKRIHLIGNPSKKQKEIVQYHCAKKNIFVTIEPSV